MLTDAGTVQRSDRLRLNADELEAALVDRRADLAGVADESERLRMTDAVEHLLSYVGLLRAAPADTRTPSGSPDEREYEPRTFAFKLEFADGRWDVDEKQLLSAPRFGETFSFDDDRHWRVYTSKILRARPAHKRAREVFICAPLP